MKTVQTKQLTRIEILPDIEEVRLIIGQKNSILHTYSFDDIENWSPHQVLEFVRLWNQQQKNQEKRKV